MHASMRMYLHDCVPALTVDRCVRAFIVRFAHRHLQRVAACMRPYMHLYLQYHMCNHACTALQAARSPLPAHTRAAPSPPHERNAMHTCGFLVHARMRMHGGIRICATPTRTRSEIAAVMKPTRDRPAAFPPFPT
eukprot:62269-Chlamydomonas_euryale.AAC.3